ncbi:hypothetical protein SAMN04490240_1014 [Rhodococcus pyridinivorans]|nr:hypothetical protein SAMN04490240_1014 [Rhodococcus pyridinivorans]
MSSTRSDRCQRGVAAVLEPSGNIARASSTGTGATVAAVIAAVVSVVSNGYGADLASSPLRTDADSCRHISADVAAGVRWTGAASSSAAHCSRWLDGDLVHRQNVVPAVTDVGVLPESITRFGHQLTEPDHPFDHTTLPSLRSNRVTTQNDRGSPGRRRHRRLPSHPIADRTAPCTQLRVTSTGKFEPPTHRGLAPSRWTRIRKPRAGAGASPTTGSECAARSVGPCHDAVGHQRLQHVLLLRRAARKSPVQHAVGHR